jgi:hypothetical protein
MLPLSSETFVFPYAIQKNVKIKIREPIIILSVVSYEYENFSHIEVRAWIQDVLEQGGEENIWT